MSSRSTYQDLAAHFMGAAEPDAPIGAGVSPRLPKAAVLVALCGNLPSMSGIWLAQLAERLARTDGPTGLVRFDDQRMRVDLFHAEGRSVAVAEDGLPDACRVVRRWIVALPSGYAATDCLIPSTELVLLTGCDEAAKAAARVKLQELSSTLETVPAAGRPVHVVTVAASQDLGAAAAGGLSQWADGELSMPVRWCGSIERVDRLEGVVTVEIKSRTRADFAVVVSQLCDALRAVSSRFDEPAQIDPPTDQPVDSPQASTTPVDSPQSLTSSSKEHAMATAPAFVDPDLAAQRTARVEAPRSSLVAWFPEFVGLRIRPANASQVELAIDMHGRLHLLSTDPSTRDLRVARSWCTANWSLLSSAVVDLKQVAAPEMVDHLVLDEARMAVPLHGSGILMHVGVEVAGQRRRIDLNDEQSAGLAG
ncbi:MAG: hypothetical protein FJ254_02215 [Phycisphaerae bacterium]|nr:hypothetical protein [Phycisphaerae bacterium]